MDIMADGSGVLILDTGTGSPPVLAPALGQAPPTRPVLDHLVAPSLQYPREFMEFGNFLNLEMAHAIWILALV